MAESRAGAWESWSALGVALTLATGCTGSLDGLLGARKVRSDGRAQQVTPSGWLSTDPEQCVIIAANGLCETVVRWGTSDAEIVTVTANGLLFAAAQEGESRAPWIARTPVLFELWGDGALLASASAVGEPPPAPPLVEPEMAAGEPVLMDARDCRATSVQSLRACHAGVLAGAYSGIALMNDIVCSGERACHLNFDHFNGDVRIYGYGADGGNVTIHRLDHFDYPILEIVTSSGISVRNLTFREGERNAPAGLFGTPGYDHNLSSPGFDHNLFGDSARAASTITVIFGSHHVTFDHVAIHEAKQFGIEIGNCDFVTVRNSWFEHDWNNGIWVTNGLSDIVENDHAPLELRIENNVFKDNRCVSLGLAAQGDSWVSGNLMVHNHMGSLWHAAGGQFAIEASTTSLIVADNELTRGRPDEDPVLAAQGWKTVGVEFTDSHVHGVTLDHNFIHDNTGGGVIHDPNPLGPRTDFGPIVAIDNVLDNPWIDFNSFDPGELDERGTCRGSACAFTRPRGELQLDRTECIVALASSTCAIQVSWTSQDTRRTVRLASGRDTVATGSSGVHEVALRPGHGRIDLYDGATLLASRYVRATVP